MNTEELRKKLAVNPTEDDLWDALCQMQNQTFRTMKGLEYTYSVRGYEMFVSRKEKSITRSSVDIAFRNAMELDHVVTGPKKLKVFGASYLYPIFLELGIARKAP